jgi:hypothetical protein
MEAVALDPDLARGRAVMALDPAHAAGAHALVARQEEDDVAGAGSRQRRRDVSRARRRRGPAGPGARPGAAAAG